MLYDSCNDAGGMTRYNFDADPRRIAFQFARYKHTAKILEGKSSALEVGCADGAGARIVRQHVPNVTAVDVDRRAIEIAIMNASDRWPVTFHVHDILDCPVGRFDAVYSLDLFEHVPKENEEALLEHLRLCAPMCVIGTPSRESQAYASDISRAGHVNCVSKSQLRAAMGRYWAHVIVLGMNDETLHTGFDEMCHYLLAIGCD